MLRNPHKSKFLNHLLLLQQQQRLIQHQNTTLYNKSTNVIRQGKIMGKLFGHRVSGSKKRWFPSTIDTAQTVNHNLEFKQTQFGKTSKGNGKNDTRRMTVLNKLFMKHITDLLATGEISDSILGLGLQVSKVKISQDFAYINVFWISSGEMSKDYKLEVELQRCSGLLRHELSQLGLMGVVPRIKFVKDKIFRNMYEVEALLKDMDFPTDDDHEEIDLKSKHQTETLKDDFYGSKTKDISLIRQEHEEKYEMIQELNANIPEMRHDVLGLDHKSIMLKIFTKMRKSKQAWNQYLGTSSELESTSSKENSLAASSSSSEYLMNNEKLTKVVDNSANFEAFLAKRKEKRNTPERKKFTASDHNIDEIDVEDQYDYHESTISSRLSKFLDTEDYLLEELDNEKHK